MALVGLCRGITLPEITFLHPDSGKPSCPSLRTTSSLTITYRSFRALASLIASPIAPYAHSCNECKESSSSLAGADDVHPLWRTEHVTQCDHRDQMCDSNQIKARERSRKCFRIVSIKWSAIRQRSARCRSDCGQTVCVSLCKDPGSGMAGERQAEY